MADEMSPPHPTPKELKTRARIQMLDVLSSEHRQRVAQQIGLLAVDKSLSIATAARDLDNLLTADERHSIESAAVLCDREVNRVYEMLRRRASSSTTTQHIFGVTQASTTRENAGVTLLAFLVEELLSHINDIKYERLR